MELMDCIKARRSIRKFKTDAVSDDTIRDLLNAARLAPSGTNIQPWRFIIIKSTEAKEKLDQCTPLPFVAKAPVIILCCMDTQSMGTRIQRIEELQKTGAFIGTPLDDMTNESFRKGRSMDENAARAYMNLNVAIAIDHLTLRATDLGLGTCWVMMFDQAKLKATFNLEDRYSPVALIPVGYPDQDPGPRPRLNLEELIVTEL